MRLVTQYVEIRDLFGDVLWSLWYDYFWRFYLV